MLRVLVVLIALTTSSTVLAAEPLFDAVKAGDTALVESLLAKGSGVDSRGHDQETLLMTAALSNQPAIAVLLVDKGADVMARNSGGL